MSGGRKPFETPDAILMDDMEHAVESASSDESRHDEGYPPSAKRKRTSISTLPDNSDRERHVCPECDRSFGRIEHMKRHAASHSTDRPFKCSVCDKAFYRLDTMQRHELIHREENETSKPKGARACTECATAKVRCSGGVPCSRCTGKDTECRYPESRVKQDEPQSPDYPTTMTTNDRAQEGNDPPLTTLRRSSLLRSGTVTGLPFSPPAWGDNAVSPAQWFPSNASLDFSVRSDYQEPTPLHRHASFAASQIPPPVLPPYTDTYNTMKPGGFVPPLINNVPTPGSIATTGTRHWLETLLEPQPTDTRDVGTPGTHTSQRTSSISETYLDGDGARLPKIGIHRRFNSRPSLPLPSPGFVPMQRIEPFPYGFPARFCHSDSDGTLRDRRLINDFIYNDMRQSFERTCGPRSSFSPVFDTSDFPSWDHIQMFISSYMDEFQPLVPMLHLPTLDICASHWLLALALATMGSHFSDNPEAEVCALALNEFLRRAIVDLQEVGEQSVEPVLLAQVKLLSCIGMTYCADDRMEQHGWRQHIDLVKYCKTTWINEISEDFSAALLPGDSIDHQWRRWRDVEARRRTGYGIWMLENMWRYEFQVHNLVALEDCKPPLPCQEVLWEAESALQWQHVRGFSISMPSLNDATQSIYIEKRVEPTMGEFSRILLIHALYSRSWEVQAHLKNPINHWMPTAAKQDMKTIPAFRESIWLPSEPSFIRWRNATCDCLDILHWRANSVTGAASGVEHPTLLHLHLARIILLTPYRAICDLAYGLTRLNLNGGANIPESTVAVNRDIVRRWAEQDQCKARLAMYHAGVLFWHIRLYSAKGFYEPPAVMLAALVLWAWGTFTPKHPAATSPNGTIPDSVLFGEGEASYPTSINIDRPADDEIVQMYIRRGDRMQAMITGVGDIRSAQGPQRVLMEGAKLTATLSNWGCSRKVMRILTSLYHISQNTNLTA